MSEISGFTIVVLTAISAMIFYAALLAFKSEMSGLTIVALAIWAMIINAALWVFNLPHIVISMHLA